MTLELTKINTKNIRKKRERDKRGWDRPGVSVGTRGLREIDIQICFFFYEVEEGCDRNMICLDDEMAPS